MTQIPPKNIFSGGANVTKMHLKSWIFSKTSLNRNCDFLSIFADDFYTFPPILKFPFNDKILTKNVVQESKFLFQNGNISSKSKFASKTVQFFSTIADFIDFI